MNAQRAVLAFCACAAAASGGGEPSREQAVAPPEQSPPLRTPEGLVLEVRSWVVESGTEPDTLLALLRRSGRVHVLPSVISSGAARISSPGGGCASRTHLQQGGVQDPR